MTEIRFTFLSHARAVDAMASLFTRPTMNDTIDPPAIFDLPPGEALPATPAGLRYLQITELMWQARLSDEALTDALEKQVDIRTMREDVKAHKMIHRSMMRLDDMVWHALVAKTLGKSMQEYIGIVNSLIMHVGKDKFAAEFEHRSGWLDRTEVKIQEMVKIYRARIPEEDPSATTLGAQGK